MLESSQPAMTVTAQITNIARIMPATKRQKILIFFMSCLLQPLDPGTSNVVATIAREMDIDDRSIECD